MTEAEKKYYDNAFKHLDKQNQAILVYLATLMTKEQHKQADEFLKRMNTRASVDLDKIKEMFKH